MDKKLARGFFAMASDDETADDLIPGSLKRAPSYHSDYGHLTYGEIKRRAASKPPDMKARRMKKLIEQKLRLRSQGRRR